MAGKRLRFFAGGEEGRTAVCLESEQAMTKGRGWREVSGRVAVTAEVKGAATECKATGTH